VIRVLVLAGSSMTRAGLESMLRANPEVEVVSGGAGPPSARQQITRRQLALEQIKNTRPDVVLVEVGSADGVITAAHLLANDAGPGLVLLADELTRSQMVRALQGGVRGILPRDATAPEISAAIEAVAAGLTAFHADDLDLLLPAHPAASPEADGLPGEPLTEREIEVLGMLAEGLGNKIIAARLNISEHTVKFHVSSILAKLGAGSRTEAVTRGVREGLIMI
jgi:NarL family two-component system response regulator YdfI